MKYSPLFLSIFTLIFSIIVLVVVTNNNRTPDRPISEGFTILNADPVYYGSAPLEDSYYKEEMENIFKTDDYIGGNKPMKQLFSDGSFYGGWDSYGNYYLEEKKLDQALEEQKVGINIISEDIITSGDSNGELIWNEELLRKWDKD